LLTCWPVACTVQALFFKTRCRSTAWTVVVNLCTETTMLTCLAFTSKAGDTLSSRHVSSCDVNACVWDARGTLNSMAQIHTSVTLLTSRDLAWSSGRLNGPARLSDFFCRTNFVRRDVRVERSSGVTSCFQKWRKCLLKKCANGPFYMTPSHPIIEISI
jgi:hypothetical protein